MTCDCRKICTKYLSWLFCRKVLALRYNFTWLYVVFTFHGRLYLFRVFSLLQTSSVSLYFFKFVHEHKLLNDNDTSCITRDERIIISNMVTSSMPFVQRSSVRHSWHLIAVLIDKLEYWHQMAGLMHAQHFPLSLRTRTHFLWNTFQWL